MINKELKNKNTNEYIKHYVVCQFLLRRIELESEDPNKMLNNIVDIAAQITAYLSVCIEQKAECVDKWKNIASALKRYCMSLKIADKEEFVDELTTFAEVCNLKIKELVDSGEIK